MRPAGILNLLTVALLFASSGCTPPDPKEPVECDTCTEPDIQCDEPDITTDCGEPPDIQCPQCEDCVDCPECEEVTECDVVVPDCQEPIPCDEEPDCPTVGVCEGVDLARCVEGLWVCDFDRVEGFEAGGETSCDNKDNDCDGATDEFLNPSFSNCLTQGVCEPFLAECVDGQWHCPYLDTENYQADVESLCDGLDNDCDGETDEQLCETCTPPTSLCAEEGPVTCSEDGNNWVQGTCENGSVCLGPGVCTVDGEFEVGSFENGNLALPVAMASLGNLYVGWFGEGLDGSSNGIGGAWMGETGEMGFAPLYINAHTLGAQESPFLAPWGDGVLAGWTSQNQDGDGLGLFGRTVLPDGTTGPEYRLTPSAMGNQQSGHLIPVGNRYLLVWTRAFSTSTGRLEAGILSEEGWPLPYFEPVTTSETVLDHAVTGVADGADSVLLVWRRSTAISSVIHLARVDVSGLIPIAEASQPVSMESGEAATCPSVVRVGPYWFVGWSETVSNRWCIQRYDEALAPVGGRICEDLSSSETPAFAMASLPDGRVFAVWQEGDSGDGTIAGQVLDSDGNVQGEVWTIAQGELDLDHKPSLVSLSGGRIGVFWAEQEPPALFSIRGRILQPVQ